MIADDIRKLADHQDYRSVAIITHSQCTKISKTRMIWQTSEVSLIFHEEVGTRKGEEGT